jgi:hypothetical protein
MSTLILFIGNSYTSRNRLPQLVADLAASTDAGAVVEVDLVFAGGASLRRHWNSGVAQRAIASRPWDFVVLQEQSTLPLKNRVRYHENVRLFHAEIAAHGARTALYLTWCRQERPDSQAEISRAIEDIGAEIDARVVPVGYAWQEARQQQPSLALYTEDGSHPTTAGSYLAACTFVGALFGQRVSQTSIAEAIGIAADKARALHAIAWAVCSARAAAHLRAMGAAHSPVAGDAK